MFTYEEIMLMKIDSDYKDKRDDIIERFDRILSLDNGEIEMDVIIMMTKTLNTLKNISDEEFDKINFENIIL